jgi:hypothetical protein
MYKITEITAVASSTAHVNIHHVCGHAIPLNRTEDHDEECSAMAATQLAVSIIIHAIWPELSPRIINRATF